MQRMAVRPPTPAARPWMRPAWPAFLALALAFPGTPARAQTGSSSVLERLQALQGQGQAAPGEATVPPPSAPLETLILPGTYRLFAGDQLHLGIYGELPRTYLLPVGPEGDLLLPGVGPIHVAGQTLRDAEAAVVATMRPLYGKARVTLRLVQAARFRVMVTGMVTKPGLYEMTGADRLSALLEQAGGIRPGGTIRRVILRGPGSADGAPAVREVDLLPWSMRGDDRANPFLEPGIRVEVAAQEATVRIRGPVVSRGALQAPVPLPTRIGDRPEEEPDLTIEFLPGDTMGTLLDQVGGLSDRATGQGYLLRGEAAPRLVDFSSADGRAVPLFAGDTIEVGYAMRWVFVTGSVRTPGRVPYLSGFDARDYVFLAGGPTEVGRSSGWTIETPDGKRQPVEHLASVPPGSTLRVPERRSYKATTWLSPLSTATALIISIVALTRR